MKATVLGGGIVGLWTADILERNGYDITVIEGSDFRNSTSAAAVCVLTPFFPGDPATAIFQRGVKWASTTLEHFKDLDHGGRFLEKIPCYEFGLGDMLESDFPVSKLDYLDFSDFKIIKLARVVADCDFAVHFECYLCNTSVFLPWLHNSLRDRGVRFVQARLRSLDDVHSLDVDLLFNCLGYQQLFPDPELYPVFGQSMFVPVLNQPTPHFGVGAGHHAVFKHRRGFYIGSFFISEVRAQPGPWEDLYKRSIEFVRGPFAQLCISVEVVPPAIDLRMIERVSSGVRPFRKSGPRVELDRLGSKTIVHNYGHGAHGWTIGYASALAATQLVGIG